jgi:Do/DeqQ family serine protease
MTSLLLKRFRLVILGIGIFVGLSSGQLAAQPTSIQRENAVVKAVRNISPAVVNISSEYEIRRNPFPFKDRGDSPFFDFFFKDFFDPGFERKIRRTSLGSGVIIDGDRGFILTNAHVIESASTITVMLNDTREFQAQVKGSDPDSDLALLQIKTDKHLPSVQLGNSDDLMIGETVIAIGNPFGFSHTVTTGVISALNRSIRTDNAVYHNFVQTDASINPGNSGGPLLNIKGELIAINTAIYAKAQGIGFAIPINTAKKIITDLIEYGEVIPVWTGIIVQNLDPRLARYMNLPDTAGVIVKEIEKDSPAEKAGLHPEDFIESVDDHIMDCSASFYAMLRKYSPGDRIKLNIWRNGSYLKIFLTAQQFPTNLALNLAERLLGIKVGNLNIYNRNKYKTRTSKGIVITHIGEQSYLWQIGARPGDIILKLDEHVINDIEDFKNTIIKYRLKTSVVILLQRGHQGYYVNVRL